MTFSRKEIYCILVYFAVLWTLVWIRAVNIPALPDEVFSYFLYGESGYYLPPEAQQDANNHIVNSILTHLSVKSFGTSLLSIRLPNVLCFVIYFISVLGISRHQLTKDGFRISFLSLTGIYYLLEFFSLSRGYGMSFAFLMLAVWQFMLLQQKFRWGNGFLLLVTVILALGSNLSLFFPIAALFVYLLFLLTLYVRERGWKTAVPAVLLAGSFAAILFVFYRYIVFLNSEKMLYYGLTEDFPFASVRTLLLELTGHNWAWMYYFLLIIFVEILLVFGFTLYRSKLSESIRDNRPVFAVLLFAALAGISVSVLYMKMPAPSERTGAHLIPLFIGAGVFLFPHLDRAKKASYRQAVILLFPLASLFMVNVSYHHFWYRDQVADEAYVLLEKEASRLKRPVTVSGSRYFDRMYAFNNTLRDNRLPAYDFESWPTNYADFLLLTAGDYNKHPQFRKAYTTIFEDPHSHNRLLKRNRQVLKSPVESFYESHEADSLEFLGIVSWKIDSSVSRNLIADVCCRFRFEASGECFIATAAVFDEKENVLMLKEQFHLNQLKSNWNNLATTRFSVPFFSLPKEAHELRLYIYNDKKVPHGQFRAFTTVYAVKQE